MGSVFQFPYRTVAEVNLRMLIRNLVMLRSLTRKEIIPVIKADAYGHGMIPIAKALVHRGSCHTLSVATLEEAIELRKKIPYAISIIVLSGFVPHQLEAYLKHRLIPMIHTLSHLKSLLNRKHLPDIHLKVDTGMHRLGIMPDEIPDAIRTLQRMEVKLSGLTTHFAESESLTSHFIDEQIKLFEEIRLQLFEHRLLHTDCKIHVANSGAALRQKLSSSVAVRPGLALFGISPNPRLVQGDDLIPILEWKARVISVKSVKKGETVGYGRTYKTKKKEKIAIVAIGYADGYPRLLSNQGQMIVGGKLEKIVGRVSMDLTAIDATGNSNVREGSLVTLIGKDARHQITAWDIANLAGTIPYEILCGISPRVPRIYID